MHFFYLQVDGPITGMLVNYIFLNTPMGNSMIRTPLDCTVFPDFLRAQNMVRVFEGKII